MALITLNPIIQSIHGKMGKIVFVHRNGTQFIRRHVIPHDPRTQLQLKSRSSFRACVALWQKLPLPYKESWNRYGKTKNRTGYNIFISENMKVLNLGKTPILYKAKYNDIKNSNNSGIIKKRYQSKIYNFETNTAIQIDNEYTNYPAISSSCKRFFGLAITPYLHKRCRLLLHRHHFL